MIIIIIVFILKLLGECIDTFPCVDRKGTDVVGFSTVEGTRVIGKAKLRFVFEDLLSSEEVNSPSFLVLSSSSKTERCPGRAGRPKSGHGLAFEEALFDDAGKKGLEPVRKASWLLRQFLHGRKFGVLSFELPRPEERGPVEIGKDFVQIRFELANPNRSEDGLAISDSANRKLGLFDGLP